jgi:tRNA modification GTPase
MLDALGNIDDCRPAVPGEFTKRAFYAGKLDLTEVEGLADLIHAETEAQRRQALLQANGVQSNLYNKWRKEILRNVAHLEAFIDFSEDENIEDGVMEQVMSSICTLESEIKVYLKDGRKGERLKNGVRTVILGAPNVGKSSLINILCQRPISIVTNIAGTTRDLIETNYNIGGFPVLLADTAGLRLSTSDPIEAEGITRAKAFTGNADLLVIMMDATKYVKYFKETAGRSNFENYIKTLMESLGLELSCTLEKKTLYIMNKADLLKQDEVEICKKSTATVVSCLHNTGIEDCVNKMSNILEEL